MLIDVVRKRKPNLISSCTGVVVGLVAITPGAGFVPVWAAVIIGLTAGPVCYYGIIFIKQKLKIDDALDAFGCHGIGGIWGGLMTGIFADPAINEAASKGLWFGESRQFLAQIGAIAVSIAVAVAGTLVCVGLTRAFTALRVSRREELVGLDISQHGENAYPSFNGLD
jgi:Amt family ammonium transporter